MCVPSLGAMGMEVHLSLQMLHEGLAEEEEIFTRSCPSAQTLFPNNPTFPYTIRDSHKHLPSLGTERLTLFR